MRFLEPIFIFFSAIIIIVSVSFTVKMPEKILVQYVKLNSIDEIIDINDSLVVPVLYDTLIIDQFATIPEQKQQFINQVLPAILIVRYELEHKSNKVLSLIEKIEKEEPLNIADIYFADSLMIRYRASSYEGLLMRLKPHPNSLVLAQAAVESGWGRSRFAVEGNNLFGVWSVAADASTIQSRFTRAGEHVYLKKYNTIAESIDHYFLTIGRHNAYRHFRLKRFDNTDVFEMIASLDKYSEKGKEYTILLQKMIKWNDFEKYDYYTIDPEYIISESLAQHTFQKIKKYLSDFVNQSNTPFLMRIRSVLS